MDSGIRFMLEVEKRFEAPCEEDLPCGHESKNAETKPRLGRHGLFRGFFRPAQQKQPCECA